MTTPQDVTRLIIPDLRTDQPGCWERAARQVRPVAEGGLGCGGFLLFGGCRETLGDRLRELEAVAGRRLLVTSDLERGAGQQVEGLTRLPHLMALGASGDESLCERAGALTATEARSVGIHVAYAPCIDLNTDPKNPIINVRAFGDDPEEVARLAVAWVRGCEGAGVLACAKHYPGHGDVTVDSHDDLPFLDAPLETLVRRELVPFRALVEAGVGTVMVAHMAVPALTGADAAAPVPVTISERAIGYLRRELGYEGLVITDALIMAGLTKHMPEADAAVAALLAGCDILLCPTDPGALQAHLLEAVRAGTLGGELIGAAIARLDRALQRVGADAPAGPSGCEGEALAREVAARGIAAIRGARPPALREASRPRVVLVSGDPGEALPVLGAELLRRVPWARLLPVGVDSPAARREQVLAEVAGAAAEGQPVAVCVASHIRASKGTAGLPGGLDRFVLEAFQRAPGAVGVALGAAYLLEEVCLLDGTPVAGFVGAAFSDEPASQAAVAELLAQGAAPTGRLPVRGSAGTPA